MAQQGERKGYDLTSNVVTISSKQEVGRQVHKAKVYLEAHKTIKISAIGESTINAVAVAERLEREGIIRIQKIHTTTHASNENNKKIQLFIDALRLIDTPLLKKQ